MRNAGTHNDSSRQHYRNAKAQPKQSLGTFGDLFAGIKLK